jgi:hydroxymethylbilane synthase
VSLPLKIGTRGSKLALYQANYVKQLLDDYSIEIVPIISEGDRDKTTPLSELGGKGVFIKAIEQSLMDGDIDIAVHSLKDMTTELALGSEIVAYLPVDSPCDALCLCTTGTTAELTTIKTIADLPMHATIATGSLRRKAQLLHHRSDLNIVPIRGNVDTRLQKLETRDIDAVMLSEAGLLRLNYPTQTRLVLDPQQFIPAPGQGVIVVQGRINDPRINDPVIDSVHTINNQDQALVSGLELEIVRRIGFDCQYPLGLYARHNSDNYTLHTFNAEPTSLQGRYMTFNVPLEYSSTDLDKIIIELIQ